MEDLSYLFTVGFSGADMVRAVIIGLLASLLISRRLSVWMAIFVGFITDRIWPYFMMWTSGYEGDAIGQAIWGAMTTLPQDSLYYLLRYAGIALIVIVGYKARLIFHRALGSDHSGKVFG